METNSLNNTYQSLLESIREYQPPAQVQRGVSGLSQRMDSSGPYTVRVTPLANWHRTSPTVDWSTSANMVLQGRGFPSEPDYVETPEPFADPDPEFFTPSKRQINVPW